MARSAAQNHPLPSWFKDYLTGVWILDNRQENLGQVSNFQASQPEEAVHGEEEQAAHLRCPTVHSGQPIVFSDEQQARPPGGSLPAPQTTARHNNEITKGGARDE
jgi:hypothetical protein